MSIPKFTIGQFVLVTHPAAAWVGDIYRIQDTGEGIEYWVTNAPPCVPGLTQPLLAWEHEIEAGD